MQKKSVIIFMATAAAMFTLVKCASGPAPSQIQAESEASQRYAELKAARLARQAGGADYEEAMLRLDELGLVDAKLYSCVKRAVEDALAHSGPEPLSHITALKKLDCDHKGIRRLNGLEHFTQLTELQLAYNGIESVEPISKLYQLKALNLNNNDIKSIWSLSGLDELKYLKLKNNPVQDLQYLGNFDRLEQVEFVLSSDHRCDYLASIKKALSHSKASLHIPYNCVDEFGEPATISEFE